MDDLYEKALKQAIIGAYSDDCPYNYDFVAWEKCYKCSQGREIHCDADRDIKCWIKYYLLKAIEEDD